MQVVGVCFTKIPLLEAEILSGSYFILQVKCPLFSANCIQTDIVRKLVCVDFHKNPLSGSQVLFVQLM